MIYFIWDSGTNAIKIGVSNFPVARLGELQIGNPNVLFLLRVAEGDEATESALHKRFADDLIMGEWFRPSQGLMRFIREASAPSPVVEAESRSARGLVAVNWLIERFREAREWPSQSLLSLASEAGISRNALYSPEVAALPIRKIRRCDDAGQANWLWAAGDGWPDFDATISDDTSP